MRALAVVELDVAPQARFDVAAAEDEEPVETLGADGADEPLGVGVRLGARTGVGTTRMPSLRNTSSNEAVNLLSRSWIKNRTRSKTLSPTSPSARTRLPSRLTSRRSSAPE